MIKLNAQTGSNYRLPTEAEWEYAAGGGKKTNRSRFGNGEEILRPSEANFDGSSAYKEVYSVTGEFRTNPIMVGSLNHPNSLGIHDMVGNVLEWCSDWYNEMYYVNSPKINPTGASSGTYRVMRGGSWDYSPQSCRVAIRSYNTSSNRINTIGFRIVSSM